MPQNHGLGRGLASLIPQKSKKISEPKEDFNYFGANTPLSQGTTDEKSASKDGIQEIDITKIVPNVHQPRLNFDQGKLQELADSIREHGIIQPIVVTKQRDHYEIIAGERRFQAAKLAGLTKVPALLKEVTPQQKLELAIIENIQRHDLNSVEEAKSYVKLAEEFGLSQEEIAQKVGKSRSVIANKIRLLQLPVEMQRALMEGKITEGHAKAILSLADSQKQKALFDLILKENLNVRQVEGKAKEISVKPHKRTLQPSPELKEVEDMLGSALGTKVKVTRAGQGGRITVEYYSKEELDNLISKFTQF